jgi:two-component system nitrate/nitrite sensor histidine kinase NarX
LLAEVAAGLASSSDLQALLQQLLEPLMRLAGAGAGTVRVLGDDDLLHLVSSVDQTKLPTCAHPAVTRDCGHCGQAVADTRVIWVEDTARCCSPAQPEGTAPVPVQHMLAVPLVHRHQVLGLYNLYFTRGMPSPEVQEVLRAVGALLGMALAKQRLEAENLRAAMLQERQMLAAELHDAIAQSLSFVKMRLPLLRDALAGREAAMTLFEDVRAGVGQAHASLRSLLTDFRAPMDARGLITALRVSADMFRRRSGTDLSLDIDVPEPLLLAQLGEPGESQVFHIVQEALNNIERHAGAQHAWVRMQLVEAGRKLEVRVEDDGAGVHRALSSNSSHYGLTIMEERARRLGAHLVVGPRDSGGTLVHMVVPLASPDTWKRTLA